MPAPLLRSTLLLALAATTCQRTPVTEAPAEPERASPPATVERSTAPAADPTHPLELVPAQARAMIMGRSPQRLAQAWARDRFVGRFPERYEKLVAEMKRDVQVDLLDPAALAAIGIDPTAPIGVAVLSFDDEAFVLFGGSSEPQAMIDLFQRLTGKPLATQVMAAAQLVRVDEELSLVFRHGMFAIVFVDRVRPGTPNYAMEVARIDPAQSLAHATAMERAHAGLPQEADIQALLDVSGIIRDELDRQRRRDQSNIGDADRRLAEARQRGASAEEINSLQQDIQRSHEFAARRRREQQIAELLLSRTFGAIEGIGLAVDASDQGLRGRIHLALAPSAVFRELFVPSTHPPAAIVALDDAPQLVVSAQVDVGIAIDLFAQAVLASGSTYARVNDEVRDALRLDFDRTLRPLLDGRGTFVLTAGPPLDPKRGAKLEEAMGGILTLGVNDETKARAMLDEVVGKWPELAFTPAPDIGGWSLSRPEWPQALYIGLIGDQLAIGSDRMTLRRIRDRQAGSASAHMPDLEAWERLTAGNAVGWLAMHHRLPVSLVTAVFRGFDSFDFVENPDEVLAAEHPDEDVFSIPRSPATRRAEQARDVAFNAHREARRRNREQRELMGWNRADALGITAGVVRPLDTGLMIEGGHYVEGGLGGYAEAIVALVETLEGEAPPEVQRARKRYDEANARALAVRRKEVERALAKPQR